MNKGTKKGIGIIIIVLLIIVVSWVIYKSANSEKTSITASNELVNKNTEYIINNLNENKVENETTENEIINEVTDEDKANKNEETTTEQVDNKNDSETVEGTTTSREEKAVELAKKYYEEEYGSIDGVYFNNQGINNGRYIIRVGSAGSVNNIFLLVDLDTETVTKK